MRKVIISWFRRLTIDDIRRTTLMNAERDLLQAIVTFEAARAQLAACRAVVKAVKKEQQQ